MSGGVNGSRPVLRVNKSNRHFAKDLDGLIVTGTVPLAPNLT
jgi:hypothetical protein